MTRKNIHAKKSLKSENLGRFVDKLDSSGLTRGDAKILGMKLLSASSVQRLYAKWDPIPAMQINYFNPDGTPMVDRITGEPFFRLRYLKIPLNFKSLTQKPARYVQRPETLPAVYYPQNQPDWPSICADPHQPLIITEGELKAAKSCKEGFPAIGVGGVYNWRSNKIGVSWLDTLAYINWRARAVYIVFDSDYRTNPMVCHALKELGEALQDKGSYVYVVSLPNLPNIEKTGLDDFLTFAGPSANKQFEQLLHEAEPLGFTQVLFNLNDRYTYIRDPGVIIDRQNLSHKIAVKTFKESLEANRKYTERTIKPDGTVQYKAISAASQWMQWPLRHDVQRLTYAPGQPTLLSDAINTWEGWGCEPLPNKLRHLKKLNVAPFLKLLDHLFTKAEPQAKFWFLQWCAYPLQNPGAKLFSSVVFHGVRHGTGKSLIGYSLARIYGKNFTEIDQDDLHDDYNSWAESKQFVMGDDVTGSNKRKDADFLKKMITQKEIRINIKYVPQYTVPDCINYFFTSQHPDSFFLEDDDRRFFIHEVRVGPLPESFYKSYMEWLDGDGPSHLFRYLLNLDLEGFNPSAAAYRTKAKERMISLSHSDLASWVRLLITNPDQVLRQGKVLAKSDLFTSKELLHLYDPDGRTGTTANGMARELGRAGLRQVADGMPIRTIDGTQARYYAVRHTEAWVEAPLRKVTEYLNTTLLGRPHPLRKGRVRGAERKALKAQREEYLETLNEAANELRPKARGRRTRQ